MFPWATLWLSTGLGVGGVLISLSMAVEPVGGQNTFWVCDKWPVWRQTYSYLSSCRASPPFDQYQIILLDEHRHMCVNNLPNMAVHWLESNLQPLGYKFSTLTLHYYLVACSLFCHSSFSSNTCLCSFQKNAAYSEWAHFTACNDSFVTGMSVHHPKMWIAYFTKQCWWKNPFRSCISMGHSQCSLAHRA